MENKTLYFLIDLLDNIRTLGDDLEKVIKGDFVALDEIAEKITTFIFESSSAYINGDCTPHKEAPSITVFEVAKDSISSVLWEYTDGRMSKEETVQEIKMLLNYKEEK